jgi:hypothetical protein
MDPFLWSAITELSEIGVDIKIDELISSNKPTEVSPRRSKRHSGTIAAAHTAPGAHPLSFPIPVSSPKAYFGDEDPQSAAKQTLVNAAKSLQQPPTASKPQNQQQQQQQIPTPFTANKSFDNFSFFSSSNHKIPPFATPSSLPSPITQSMLSIGGMGRGGGGGAPMSKTTAKSHHPAEHDEDAMITSPYSGYDSSMGHYLHPHTGESETGEGDQLGQARRTGPLFGMPTPASTAGDLSHDHDHHQEISAIPGSAMNGSEYDPSQSHSILMEMNSALHQKTGAGADKDRRRVSFGPTARLSFSGAFDNHPPLPPTTTTSVQNQAISALQEEDSFTRDSSKLATAEDDQNHPYKFSRMDDAKKTTNSHLLPPSPYSIPPAPSTLSPIRNPNHTNDPNHTMNKTIHHLEDHSHHFEESLADIKQPTPVGTGSTTTTAVFPPHPPAEPKSPPDHPEKILAIISTFARALQLLNNYYCVECIEALRLLPETHYQSGLVSQIIGKACVEMNEYKGAVIAFREMRRLEPYRMQGLELFSSALWHLREDKELSTLAQQV